MGLLSGHARCVLHLKLRTVFRAIFASIVALELLLQVKAVLVAFVSVARCGICSGRYSIV